MTGAEKIIERILEEARSKAEAAVKEAEKEAKKIMSSAEEDAKVRQKIIIDKAFTEAEGRKKRLIAVAELEGSKEKLKTKQQMIEEVFSKTVEKLNSLPAQEYEDILIDMVVNSVESGDEEVILSGKDIGGMSDNFVRKINDRLIEKGKKGKVTLSQNARSIKGGFILKKGDVEINNSFETIIKMQRDELEELVVAQLF